MDGCNPVPFAHTASVNPILGDLPRHAGDQTPTCWWSGWRFHELGAMWDGAFSRLEFFLLDRRDRVLRNEAGETCRQTRWLDRGGAAGRGSLTSEHWRCFLPLCFAAMRCSCNVRTLNTSLSDVVIYFSWFLVAHVIHEMTGNVWFETWYVY